MPDREVHELGLGEWKRHLRFTRYRAHCQTENPYASEMHLILSRRNSKGLDFLSRLDRTLAGKSDEPGGVIRIFTVDNIHHYSVPWAAIERNASSSGP